HCHAGPARRALRLSPAGGGALGAALADHGVQAARPQRTAPRAHHRCARALREWGIARPIPASAGGARLAQDAGYDGVEIMGSEGYLINQFVAPRTNHRDDEWGGAFANRIRFPVE